MESSDIQPIEEKVTKEPSLKFFGFIVLVLLFISIFMFRLVDNVSTKKWGLYETKYNVQLGKLSDIKVTTPVVSILNEETIISDLTGSNEQHLAASSKSSGPAPNGKYFVSNLPITNISAFKWSTDSKYLAWRSKGETSVKIVNVSLKNAGTFVSPDECNEFSWSQNNNHLICFDRFSTGKAFIVDAESNTVQQIKNFSLPPNQKHNWNVNCFEIALAYPNRFACANKIDELNHEIAEYQLDTSFTVTKADHYRLPIDEDSFALYDAPYGHYFEGLSYSPSEDFLVFAGKKSAILIPKEQTFVPLAKVVSLNWYRPSDTNLNLDKLGRAPKLEEYANEYISILHDSNTWYFSSPDKNSNLGDSLSKILVNLADLRALSGNEAHGRSYLPIGTLTIDRLSSPPMLKADSKKIEIGGTVYSYIKTSNQQNIDYIYSGVLKDMRITLHINAPLYFLSSLEKNMQLDFEKELQQMVGAIKAL